MKSPRTHILSGITRLVKPWRDGSRNDFDQIPLNEMFGCIKRNFAPSRSLGSLSRQNWRLVEQPKLSEKSISSEKILEKRITSLLKPKWVNQVPTASGYCQSGDRKRSIDLVFRSADSTFIFYELKVLPESGNAFDATIELLGYGLLYIYSRLSLDEYKECSVMKAQTIHLRVLGTWDYYRSKRTSACRKLQDAISLNVNQYAAGLLRECAMDFQFDTFPRQFKWSVGDKDNDKKIVSAVEGIHALFGTSC
jgi:hypothetical protein